MEKAKLVGLNSLFNESYQIFKKQPWFYVGVTLALIFINIGFSSIGQSVHGISSLFVSLVSIIVQVILQMGYITIMLKAVRGGHLELNDFFSKINLFWQFLGAVVVSMLAVYVGMIFLIIPGLILFYMFMFTSYIVIDGGETGILNPIKKSKAITKGYKWKLFVYSIVFGLFNLLGLLVVGVGLLITVPISSLAIALLFVKMKEMKNIPQSHTEIEVQPQELPSHVA
jgi:uncharacterized membrane protein